MGTSFHLPSDFSELSESTAVHDSHRDETVETLVPLDITAVAIRSKEDLGLQRR